MSVWVPEEEQEEVARRECGVAVGWCEERCAVPPFRDDRVADRGAAQVLHV